MQPLRIAIDLRMVGAIPHGIARYATALWKGLPARSDVRYLALVGSAVPPTLSSQRPGDELIQTHSRFLSPLEQIEVPALLRRAGAALFHATSFSVPLAWRGPLILTLHDLTHLRVAEFHDRKRRAYYKWVVAPAARRAKQILTVSAFERGELQRWLRLPAERIAMAPDAVEFVPLPQARADSGARPLLLYVGNGKPHKNVELIVEAVQRLEQPAHLLLVGKGLERFRRQAVEVRSHVEDDELQQLYARASLFLFPSRSEGFGLPPLEAARLGTPVLVADAAALPELWRGVAPVLSPTDPEAWRQQIDLLLSNPRLRQALAERCARHAEQYVSWAPMLALTERSYRKALDLPAVD